MNGVKIPISLKRATAALLLGALILLASCDQEAIPPPKKSVTTTPAILEKPKENASTPDKSASKNESTAVSEIPVAGSAMLDGFEGPEHTVWSFDSADDEGIAEYVEDEKTQGKKALRITLRDKGSKGKLHLRRDIELDLSQASALLFDLHVNVPASDSTEPEKAGKPTKFSAALAIKAHPGDVYQEIKPLPLKSGLNRDVRFALEGKDWKNERTKWEYAGPPVNLKGVHRVMLLIFTGDAASGSITVDNLRVEGALFKKAADAGAVYREWRPEFLQVPQPPPQAIARFQTFEVPVILSASYRDVFDPNDLVLGMRVQTPSGKSLDVRGFFAGVGSGSKMRPRSDAEALEPFWGPFKPEKKSKKKSDAGEKGEKKSGADDKKTDEKAKSEKPSAEESAGTDPTTKPKKEEPMPIWMLRFTPLETGRYTLQMYARNSSGETRLPESAMVVAPEIVDPAHPGRTGGNVRVSRRDGRHLELQDNTPFYMSGLNVCWTQDWAPYLKKIKEYGGNTCRIWLCPWGLNLEKKTEPGTFDLQEAQRLDALMATAEETGVRIIFCFTFHGMNGDFWHDSPYNQLNGGPCGRPQEFFTDFKARRQFKRLLSYAAARWGPSPALLSWELINEINLARFDDPEDVLNWSREMAGHLKSVDTHGHLVTTSSTNVNFTPDVWWDRSIDFVSVHGYAKEVEPLVQKYLSPYQHLNKPVILAEFGGGTEPADDIPDKDGARLQASLWLTACSPSCGTALPWWWDTYIEARNLYPVLASAQRFVAGEDRRGRYQEWVRKSYGPVLVNGIMDSQGARLYVHNPNWVRSPETRGKALFDAAQQLELNGMIDGVYKVEYWNAKEGKAVNSIEVAAREGRLTIELPAQTMEMGVKVDRKQRLRPELK